MTDNLSIMSFPIVLESGKRVSRRMQEILNTPELRAAIKKPQNRDTAFSVMEYLYYSQPLNEGEQK